MKGKRHLLTLAVAILAGACYANTLANGFVFDDLQNILENRWITSIRYVSAMVSSHAAGFDQQYATSYYRPAMHLIYLTIYQVFGLAPWGFHLVNVLFHMTATALVFLLCVELVRRLRHSADEETAPTAMVPLIAAGVFAVHPVHTEAVAWLAGITDLSFSTFFLLAFWFYVRAEAGWKLGAPLGAATFFAAALSKEPALMLLPLLLIYEALRRQIEPAPFWGIARRFVPFAVAGTVYIVIRVTALGGFAPGNRTYELTVMTAVLTAGNLISRYIYKLVWPYPLSALYEFEPITSPGSLQAAAGMAGLAILACTTWVVRNRPLLAIGVALTVLPLLPVLYIPALGEGAFAERYLYLPVAGAALLAAIGGASLANKAPAWRGSLVIVCAGILLVLGAVTIQRNTVWRDSLSLWSDTATRLPKSAVAHEFLCWALYSSGRYQEAIGVCNRALEARLPAG